MPQYEYKVVPAPSKGRKAKGVKTPEGRFAVSVEAILNEMGALGWEYLRAELLPSDERSGLTGSSRNWRNVLIFRRELAVAEPVVKPRLLESPERSEDTAPPVAAPAPVSEAPDAAPAVGAADEFDVDDAPEEAADPKVTPLRTPPSTAAPSSAD